ncbi:malonyl-ACP O-methyltransferase BioC [Marinobacter psychrophilus]|jgi:malonyl-CoA O-methyltransferase|uniref:malonyl-ACP O-methyltransferase BioC n=1 Tax=Marinobacter psychrophilus TaxID=330734 RepID=UPI001B6DDE45|nr:malonyl-ACP O-methyltransferase BioC [Marinobacter psychrophilus]MBQ0763458.1 malonyl-ACP O-methyltransferase BioC [Marinobacter psychrophilus]MBQ0845483.1 malonyl-ACP O-methyltransferase BioC [Marinobacter psychrophilus]
MFATKQAVASDFGGASASYEGAARLQRKMGDAMLETIAQAVPQDATVIDLGCGTGWYTRQLAQRFGAHTVGVDLAPGMLAFAKAQSKALSKAPSNALRLETIQWLEADAERLPLAGQSVDLIYSNLMIQWCHNPQGVLRECQRVLRPGGQLWVSTLLLGTLQELQQAWTLADPHQQHVNGFISAADFAAITVEILPAAQWRSQMITLDYPTPMALMNELRQLGAGYKDIQRRKTATAPGRLKQMCQNYPQQPDGSIVASYHAGWLEWRKPLLTPLTCD